jgi:WD40 repeat protein
MSEQRVQIFVSSPADVDHERALVKDIIEGLAQEYLPYFKLQPVLWEEEALTAAQSFQAGLLRPAECDIVLVMLWTRLGTPLANDPYGGMTGTEWEFADAVEASASAGRPEVLVYKKTTPRLVDITNTEATREALEDRGRLETFFRTHFYNPDGSFRRAFRQFDSDRALRELVEGQLRKLLNRRISAERGTLAAATDWRESPFRPEGPFDLGDEPVFVGRETETRELVSRLDALKGSGRGLLLITGASGVGKSSLIRAGLLPRLARPFLFAGIAGCRWCVIDCATAVAEADPLEILARALMNPSVLGAHLSGFGLDAPGLARILGGEPEVAAEQVSAALAQGSAAAGAVGGAEGRIQLALIVDALDGLFSMTGPAAAATHGFVSALAALAAREGVWVIACLGSDHLRQIPRIPALAALVDRQSWIELEPPPAARIRQVLEIPARVAGIEYETGGGAATHGLLELLESEAADLHHWPPLLEGALHQLFVRAAETGAGPETDAEGGDNAPARQSPRLLRLADYRALGGIAGAALERAQALWAGLGEEERAALPVLCRALLAFEGGALAHPTARAGDLRTLRRDPACASLLQALIDARLVVAEGVRDPASNHPCGQAPKRVMDALIRVIRETRDEWRARRLGGRVTEDVTQGAAEVGSSLPSEAGESRPEGAGEHDLDWRDYRPVATLVHPVLVEQWAPIRDWLRDPANRRDLQLRTQIGRQARLWKRTDCNREYLLGEVGYAGARGFADAHGPELEPLELEYLEHSRSSLLFQRRRNRAVRLFGLTLALLLVVASGAALWAWNASREATINLHRSLLNEAQLAISQGNTPEAVRLAFDAGAFLPQAATDVLSRAFASTRLIAMAQGSGATPSEPLSPAFSDDGDLLVTLSATEGARLWSLKGNLFVPQRHLAGPEAPIHAVRIAGSGPHAPILGIGVEGTWQLPLAEGAPPDWACGGERGGVVALDASRRYLALSHPAEGGRTAVCVSDLQRPGASLWDRPLHRGEIRDLSFAPDGMTLVTASREGVARVVDTLTGLERLVLPKGRPLSRPINAAVFDGRGERIALASADEQVRVYGPDGELQNALGTIERDGQAIRVHKTAVRDVAFTADGRYILAVDDAGQLVRWGFEGETPEILGQHRLSIEQVSVTARPAPREGEPVVLTASIDKTARLWGLLTGKELAVFSHDAAVSSARFSTDGRRVLTYSDLDGSARLWSVEPASMLAQRLPHEDHVWHLDLAAAPRQLDSDPGALLLATASFDGRVRVWRFERHNPEIAPLVIWDLAGHRNRVRRVRFSPSARLLASAGYDGSARVWSMETGGGCVLEMGAEAQGESQGKQATMQVHQVLFAPDERWLLTTGSGPDRPVRLWDPLACAELPLPPALDHGQGNVQAAAVIATAGATGERAQRVATGSDAGTLRVMEQQPDGGWRRICQTQVSWRPILDLAFSPDGRTVAAAGEDGRAELVSIGDQGCDEPLILDGGNTTTLYSVAFAPDGEALVTAGLDGQAEVWSRRGDRLADLVGHKDRIYQVAFSPDGRWLLTASRDGTVRVWRRPGARDSEPSPGGLQVSVQSPYLVLDEDLGGVAYAQFSPSGNSIAAAYWENAAVLWRLWAEGPDLDPALTSVWGPERARLALIQEAARFYRDNRLGTRVQAPPSD